MASVKFNSLVVLSVTAICVLVFLLHSVTGVFNDLLMLEPEFGVSNIHRMFTYVFAHANYSHILGNLSIYLLIGPILEEKYGYRKYLTITVVTTLVTALANVLFFDSYLLGLSGVVFMNIILASFTNVKEGEIPVTFILVVILFVGQEVYNALSDDNVSQFAHIFGGAIGSVFGFLYPSAGFRKDQN